MFTIRIRFKKDDKNVIRGQHREHTGSYSFTCGPKFTQNNTNRVGVVNNGIDQWLMIFLNKTTLIIDLSIILSATIQHQKKVFREEVFSVKYKHNENKAKNIFTCRDGYIFTMNCDNYARPRTLVCNEDILGASIIINSGEDNKDEYHVLLTRSKYIEYAKIFVKTVNYLVLYQGGTNVC